MRPLVLMTPDVETQSSSRRPGQTRYHVIGSAYTRAVEQAGGTPFVCPYLTDDGHIAEAVSRVQAVVLTGGDFDVDPALFGEAPHPSLGTIKKDRTAFERAVYREAIKRSLPILGVCGGMQLMNIERGGDLYQDIKSQKDDAQEHEQKNAKDEAGHEVTIEPGTVLAAAFGQTLGVNSTHHQGVRRLGSGLIASAHSEDGLIEAFEDKSLPFFVGVQWHPESMKDGAHLALYRALIKSSS